MILEVLNDFAKFNLPLKVTEFDFVVARMRRSRAILPGTS